MLRAKRYNAPGWSQWLVLVLLILLISPAVVSYASYRPSWDDAFFMQRALVVGTCFWDADFAGLSHCLRYTFKSPIMAFLALSWGQRTGTATDVGLLLVSLAVVQWAFVFLALRLMWRLSMSPYALLAATLCVVVNPFVRSQAGVFMADPLLSWIVVCTVLLVAVELQPRDVGQMGTSVMDGVLWGVILCAGLLCKATYLYFALLAFPTAIIMHWRRNGVCRTARLVCMAAVVCLPALTMWWAFGISYLAHAASASWGSFAPYYAATDSSWSGYWVRLGDTVGLAKWIFVPFSAMAVWHGIKCGRRWRICIPAAILLG